MVCLSACSDDEPTITPPVQEEDFAGEQRVITIVEALDDFRQADYQCVIKAEDGTIITRSGVHQRIEGKSILTLDTGLRPGTYRLLYLQTPLIDGTDTLWVEHGLGCRIKVSDSGIEVLDTYNSAFKFYGDGTKDNPFTISSSDHLKTLRNLCNDGRTNSKITAEMYFSQSDDIDMHTASKTSDGRSGWMPIGNQPSTPFRGIYLGNGHTISRLWIDRPNSAGVGLFGYVEDATFYDVKIVEPDVNGMFAVGALTGCTVTKGDRRSKSDFYNCSTTGGKVVCPDGSVAVGGLVGEIDVSCTTTFDQCSNRRTQVSGDYGIGGIVGNAAIFSSTLMTGCSNSGDITSAYTGAGGLIGVADTLTTMNSSNTGDIVGGVRYNGPDGKNGGFGTGGIAGGTGMSWIYTSSNSGSVTGHTGVGGMVGSTRVSTDEGIFNNCLIKFCSNSGEIYGQTSVGGLCGEAQFGCYSALNTGTVKAVATDAHVGGIVGNTSIAVVHNALNSGTVSDVNSHAAGGIIGKTTWGSIYNSQNLGAMNVTADYAGGVIGLAGNYTVINYCLNAGKIANNSEGPTGGIVGEIGDPREWEPLDIANCVIGAIECVLGAAGPLIAITEEALEGATGVLKFLKIAMVVGEKVLDGSTIAYDFCIHYYTLDGMINPEEFDKRVNETINIATENAEAIAAELAKIRAAYAFSASGFPSQLNAAALAPYMANVENLVTFEQASENNNQLVTYNLNNAREERIEEMEDTKLTGEIAHYVTAGICLIVAGASFFASFFTAGTASAGIVLAMGTLATVTGGANAICESCTDYKTNVVVVSQCANFGEIIADRSDVVGGIAGRLQQYCYMTDCLNAGHYVGSSDNNSGIVDRGEGLSEIRHCLNVGADWGSAICGSHTNDCVFHHNYFFHDLNTGATGSNDMVGLDLDELCNPDKYDKWSFTGDYPLWSVTQTSGYFPVPLNSEMQKPKED